QPGILVRVIGTYGRENAYGNIDARHSCRSVGTWRWGHVFLQDVQVRLGDTRHGRKQAIPFGRRRSERRTGSRGLTIGRVFEVAKIEEPVLHDRSANRSSDAILVEARLIVADLPEESL